MSRTEGCGARLGREGGSGVRFTLCMALACVAEVTVAGPPTVQDLVNQFCATNYFNIVSNKLYTRQGMNRAPLQLGGMEHDLCRDAIYDEFQRVGLSPSKDPWSYVDTTNITTAHVCNIIALKEGVQNPNNEIYVIGAHYDSKANPGADDNSTGVGCALEMARIFARQYFAKTIVFAVFDSEERWATNGAHRLGSLRYVAQHTNDNIKGMISVDMIGWQSSGSSSNQAWIYGRPTVMDPIRNDLRAAITSYGSGLIPVLRTGLGDYSDHVAFADAGFQACLLIEANFSGNPNYHKSTDYVELPGYLDWTYLEKMCKSVIGYYATQLQPVDVTPKIFSVQPGGNGGMLVAGAGLPRCQYAIELCTNLISPVWVAVETNTAAATDGTFTIFDPQADRRPSGFYRARFVSGYAGSSPHSIVIDNPVASVAGTWTTGTSSTDKYGANYYYTYAGAGAAYVEFRPNLPASGHCQVFEWHPQGSNRTTNAPVVIAYDGGTRTNYVNQTINGGTWVPLGTPLPFAPGTAGYVWITDAFPDTSQVVMADAIKFVYVP